MSRTSHLLLLLGLLIPTVSLGADKPQWIWSGPEAQDGETILFRRVIQHQSDQPVYLTLTCDNEYTLFINGNRIAESRGDGNWKQLDGYRIDSLLKPGANVIGIRARNLGDAAGLVVRVASGSDADSPVLTVSDKSWLWSLNYAPGWSTNPTADKSWKPAHEIGEAGATPPWGALLPVPADGFVEARARERKQRDKLADGESVVLLGGTLFERAQRFGQFETALTRRLSGKGISFRNLGWSADTVWADSRGIFDSPAKGYARMIEQIRELEADWVIVNYGQNESFKGPAGVAPFLAQLERLVSDLQETGTSIVLAGPTRQLPMPAPLPPIGNRNDHIDLYTAAVSEFAGEHQLPFVDLGDILERTQAVSDSLLPADHRVTENGLHLTEAGYWIASEFLAERLLKGLGIASETSQWAISVDTADGKVDSSGVTLRHGDIPTAAFDLIVVDSQLPAPRLHGKLRQERLMKVAGLPAGNYALLIDEQRVVEATAEQWARGVLIGAGMEFEHAEQLRRLIVQKNELYFHHWRPQNITYLFLFRKHEQGNNAREVEEFKLLVAEVEEQIKLLNKPTEHVYQLRRVKAVRGEDQ